MVNTYEELKKLKENGTKLDWENIEKEQLEELFINEDLPSSFIADLYDVSKSKVNYKRSKWNITVNSAKYFYKNYVENNKEVFEKLNNKAKERLLDKKNIDWLSKALTHYVFRNGPVEDIHSNGNLSQQDMKILNKYMVNQFANLLSLVLDNEWLKIELLLNYLAVYGHDWDKAEIDLKEIDTMFNNAIGLK